MDPGDLRTLVLTAVLIFVGLFGAMTAYVIAEQGIDALSVAAVLILILVVPPLIAALRNPPRD